MLEENNFAELDQLIVELGGERIDKYLAAQLEDLSRSRIQTLLADGMIKVNGQAVKAKYKLEIGDSINICLPELKEVHIEAQNIPLDIVYEDDDLLVVNKPKGMVVHPAAGHLTGTLVNAIMYHCKDNLSGINGELRPGIVHRIDMNTTGLLVVCKNDFTHERIAAQLAVHSITRVYEAIVLNRMGQESGCVDAPIGRSSKDRKKMAIDKVHGKRAVTHYQLIKNYSDYAHIACRLETGRTHQIRVHMKSIGHPLLGDDIYGSGKSPFKTCGQTLHAKVLGFVHPRSGQYMEFNSELPEYFQDILNKLDSKN